MPKSSVGKRQNGGIKSGASNRGKKRGQGALKAGSALKHSNASSKAGRTAPNGETQSKGPSNFRSENTIKPMRIQPDRRWFGNTRVIAQNKMQAFRETLAKKVQDPYSIVLKSSKL